jgi:hypothetical protein
MKLQLNKKKLKNLSKDAQVLSPELTPHIAGAGNHSSTNRISNDRTTGCQSRICETRINCP